MIRYALRRLLWVVPMLLVLSLLSFLLLADATPAAANGADDVRLPLFFNSSPRDASQVAERALAEVVSDDPQRSQRAAATLTRLGGAGLPLLLPKLDSLSPEQRVLAALALAPIAERMGIDRDGASRNPRTVVVFWDRFWKSHGIEFREASARAAVRRYARFGTEARAEELRILDTYALPALIGALPAAPDAADVVTVRRLTDLLSHCSGRDDRLARDAEAADAAAVTARWRRWWASQAGAFRRLSGASRIAAFVLQTRYARWIGRPILALSGEAPLQRAFRDELAARTRVTASLLFAGLGLAYLLALPFGALSALRRRRWFDRVVRHTALLLFAVSPAALAAAALALGFQARGSWLWATLLLALTLMAEPLRTQRQALQRALLADHVDAVTARGGGWWQQIRHALPGALFPVLTRASQELPVALTACFVLEKALDLPGLGAALIRAVGEHDARWLMAAGAAGVALAVVTLLLSDLAKAWLDPRLPRQLFRSRRRHG